MADLQPERWFRDTNGNKIDDVIERIESGGLAQENFAHYVISGEYPNAQVSLLVTFSRPLDDDDIRTLSQIVDLSKVYRFQYINAVSIREVSPSVAGALAKLDGVVMVELQQKVHSTLNVSACAVKARPSAQYSGVWDLGIDGTGVNIAIVDTGVDDEHESLRGKYVAGADFTGPSDLEFNPDDRSAYDEFHGTHAAGIAMGTGGKAGTYKGIAPGAGLIDLRALDEKGEGTSESIIRAVEWSIRNKDNYNIRILSMSLGIEELNSDGKDSVSQAVNAAVQKGIVVVAAVGNDGSNNYISAPAAADGAIAVGALYDRGSISRTDDTVASYSNRGPRLDDRDSDPYDELKPDVTAPGTYITSAKGSNGQASSEYHQLSGTSMATPHVAGVVALMLNANPDLTPAEVKEILHETSEARGLPYDPELSEKYNTDFGWGIVDAYAAVMYAMENVGPPDFTLSSGDISFSDTTPVDDQRILITATIRNIGKFDGTCDVVFYREDTGRKLRTVKDVQVKAEGSKNVSIARKVKQGVYQVRVVVENARPAEDVITNNQASASVTVGPAPFEPDLTLIEKDIHFPGKAVEELTQILSANFSSPEQTLKSSVQDELPEETWALQQQSVTIKPKIHNVGQTGATFDVKIYYDEKTPEKLIDNFYSVYVEGLSDNSFKTTWAIPPDLYGDHAIYVVIENPDPGDSDPLNNEASRVLSLPWKMESADVAVAADDITFSDNAPSAGSRVIISVAVHNIGVIDVENVKVALYIDNVPTALGTISYIKQGSENSASIEWVAEGGDHEIGVYVSLEMAGVEESSKTNNTAFTFISVRAGIPWTVLVIAVAMVVVAVAVFVKRHRAA